MGHKDFKFLLLGGGQSGGYAASEFVKRGGKAGELGIITDEGVVSYERPTLSKGYLFPESPPRLPGFHATVGGGGDRQLPEWYKENGIEYVLNTRVEQADLKAKKLTATNGDTFGYEKLIIATGTRAIDLADFKTPGADLKGLFYLRNIQDADKLVAAIKDVKGKSNSAVVVGGGYIGLETAAALTLNGIKVTMVFPEDRLMSRLFSPDIAAYYEGVYKAKGVTLIKNAQVTAFEGSDGKVTHAVLSDGQKLEAELVLVGVGAKPNTELFKGQIDLLEERPGGIKVDAHLQTSDPSVYAVGDIAAFPLIRYGGEVTRQEHVLHARNSARHAVAELLGDSSEYSYTPFFYSREFNLSWQLYGLSDGDTVEFGDKSSGKFGAFFVKDGVVHGGFIEGGSPEEQAGIKKVAEERPKAPADLASQGLAFATSL